MRSTIRCIGQLSFFCSTLQYTEPMEISIDYLQWKSPSQEPLISCSYYLSYFILSVYFALLTCQITLLASCFTGRETKTNKGPQLSFSTGKTHKTMLCKEIKPRFWARTKIFLRSKFLLTTTMSKHVNHFCLVIFDKITVVCIA